METRQLRGVLDAFGEYLKLPEWRGFKPGEWLEAIIRQESTGDPRARRYERHQDAPGRSDAAGDADRPGVDDGMVEDDASYGLMQIMGYNIRHLTGVAPGKPQEYSFAFLPLTNIVLGLRVLLGELNETAGNVDRALARYNGGPTGDSVVMEGGIAKLRRQVYVDGVLRHAERVHQERAGG